MLFFSLLISIISGEKSAFRLTVTSLKVKVSLKFFLYLCLQFFSFSMVISSFTMDYIGMVSLLFILHWILRAS